VNVSPKGWENVREILVVRLDNVGDVVMTGPALRTLKAALPEARITLMASQAGSRIAPLLPWVDRVMTHRAVWQDLWGAVPQDAEEDSRLVADLRERAFDAAVILTSFSQSPWPPAYACWRAGIPLRIGQSTEFGGSLLSQWVQPSPREVHQVDRNLHLLEQAGFEPGGRELELVVPSELDGAARGLLRNAGLGAEDRFLAIAPFATCTARTYAPDRFAEVLRRLTTETRMPAVVLGGEREAGLAKSFLALTRGYPVHSLVGRATVAEQAAVIGRSALMLTNDSGPMHIADALGRPTVVLFSGTELEEQWRPRTTDAAILRRDTVCSPCYAFACPNEMQCLDIPPEEVVGHALRLLEKAALTAA
jgi:ADP-heptose:LPS heptosyltransferase